MSTTNGFLLLRPEEKLEKEYHLSDGTLREEDIAKHVAAALKEFRWIQTRLAAIIRKHGLVGETAEITETARH